LPIHIDYKKFYNKHKDTINTFQSVNENWPGLKIFYGYSGPKEREGSFEYWVHRVAASCGYSAITTMADSINGTDFLDDFVWKGMAEMLKPGGSVHGSLWSPPCSTFSRARKNNDGGPRPLRGAAVPELLGLPHLDPGEKESVRKGTLLANRAAEGITLQKSGEKPWILENPPELEGEPSIFNVPDMAKAVDDAFKKVFPQCAMNANSTKMTEWRSAFELRDAPPKECAHPREWWRRLPDGKWLHRSHAPLKGKFKAVTPSEWNKLAPWEREVPEVEYLTRAAAAYPSMLNCYLACQLVPRAILAAQASRMVRGGTWGNVLARPRIPRSLLGAVHTEVIGPPATGRMVEGARLAGHSSGIAWHSLAESAATARRAPDMRDILRQPAVRLKEEANKLAIGGMRKPQISIEKLPSLIPVGKAMREILEKFLDENPVVQDQCLNAVGNKSEEGPLGPSEEILDAARRQLADLFRIDNIEPVSNGDFSTEIRAGLLGGWQRLAGDPDWAVVEWLESTGVPAGMAHHPQDCGIFPRNEPSEASSIDEEQSNPDTFIPYSSVEQDDDAWAEIQRIRDKKWIKQFDTLEEMVTYLGDDPILSKFGMVVKVRFDKVKKRLILDSKKSGVSAAASKLERVILPRLLDAALDILHLLATGKEVEVMVLDFSDAFWLLPLAPEERKWFTSRIRGKYFVFLRNAQGSRNAPLGWGRVSAMMGRATQSMFTKDEARLEIYTDDPFVSVAGTKERRDRCFAIIILFWRCMGFPLSWHKGSRGSSANWIGGEFKICTEPKGVVVRIKQDIFEESGQVVEDMLSKNVIPMKMLRSGIGKLSHISNLLVIWRPFMRPLYAALYSPTPSGCPPNCCWTRQVAQPLRWFKSFFKASGGFVEREFMLDAFQKLDTCIEIVMDASPWGIAGILYVDDVPTEFFSDKITALDETLFGHKVGSPDGQQVWESLSALVSLRLWVNYWNKRHVVVRVRGDSVAMLTLVVNMRPKSAALTIIGQELALTIANAVFVPIVAEHIPGIANVAADQLSRWYQPNTPAELPLHLHEAQFRHVPKRTADYYLSITE